MMVVTECCCGAQVTRCIVVECCSDSGDCVVAVHR